MRDWGARERGDVIPPRQTVGPHLGDWSAPVPRQIPEVRLDRIEAVSLPDNRERSFYDVEPSG
jgi:hypothetical protein